MNRIISQDHHFSKSGRVDKSQVDALKIIYFSSIIRRKMFAPHFEITPQLLETIKRLTLLTYELNQRRLSEAVLLKLQEEARAVSAFASTSIEGNPLPLTEVKRLLRQRPENLRQSEREVLNYNQALQEVETLAAGPLTTKTLLRIHRAVTEGLLPKHQSGRLRQEPVLVRDPRTGEVVYWPPDHQQAPELVADLLAFVAEQRGRLDAVILAGLFHKQLVIIHPFMDGNGRTARLATTVLLAGLGLQTLGLFSFENYYNRNVGRYFEAVGLRGDFNEMGQQLDFTPWLEYFAEGILDELLRVQKELERHPAGPDSRLKPHHQAILEHIERLGFITDRDYARLTERAKATRSLDFNHLIRLGLIVRRGRGRAVYYVKA